MIIIPGFVISALTFPGIIIHEIAHRFFADLAGVPVYAVKYYQFDFGGKAGYVIHGQPTNLKDSLLISVGPLLVNTLLCSLLTFVAFPMFLLSKNPLVALPLVWIGLSSGMHAFPSNHDMDVLVAETKRLHKSTPLNLLALLFSWLFKIVNLLQFFWFDAIYAIFVALALPMLFRLT
ncbi:MAG TPA: hypothetical protein VF209_03980 [Patescibacteria group bacterium]